MSGYIANFTVYTMAMIGLICFAVFVYKKFTDGTMRSGENKFLSVEDSMSLSPRKTLHIVRAGGEKFLIASDVDRTTLISKLNANGEKQSFLQSAVPAVDVPIFEAEPVRSLKHEEPEMVHLEPIRPKTQVSQPRSRMDRRAGQMPQTTRQTVTLDFESPKKHGFSTMREMAMKINEL